MNSEAKALRAAEKADLTSGPIAKKLLMFALPLIIGSFAQQLYNVVDSIIVGNFAANGTECLAAVNASFAVMMAFNAIFMGISMGTNIIISQYKGAGDMERLEKTMTTTFALSMWAGLAITVIGFIFTKPLLLLLGTPENILENSVTYLRIVFIGTCANFIYNGMSGMIRGLGDSKWPLYALLFASGLNIVLDTLFVVCFHWDVAGVAWATIISQVISGAILIWKLNTGCYKARINFRHPAMDKQILKHIVRLGAPAAIQGLAFSCGSMITQSFANRFGSDFIAANAIIMKVDGFAIMPMMGLGNAVTTYVGQNVGAGNMDRVNKGVKLTLIMAVSCSLFVGILLIFFGKYLMKAFGVDEHVLDMGIKGLNFIALFYSFMAVQNVLGGTLRGAGDSATSALTSVVSTFIRVPLGYFLAIVPLNKAIDKAVEAGLYASRELAEAAGVGLDKYMGLFQTWAYGMLIGAVMIIPFYIFGKWREKGITDKAKAMRNN
jgi:putative MATE family efflux protein